MLKYNKQVIIDNILYPGTEEYEKFQDGDKEVNYRWSDDRRICIGFDNGLIYMQRSLLESIGFFNTSLMAIKSLFSKYFFQTICSINKDEGFVEEKMKIMDLDGVMDIESKKCAAYERYLNNAFKGRFAAAWGIWIIIIEIINLVLNITL